MRFLALLLLIPLLACKQGQQDTRDYSATGTPAHGDMFVSASIGGATNLVPWLAGESASSEIASSIYDSLLKYDGNLNLIGQLAERWEVAPDNLTLTFYLKKNVLWHDGQPFTSADVLATVNALLAPNTRTPYAGDYQTIARMETPDAHTFKVTYKEPFAPALSSWAGLAILPKHILELDKDVNETRLKTQPMGTGPYTLTSWDAGTETVLTANPRYFGGEPYINKLRLRVIPDQDTQFMELKAGRIDTMGLKPVQFTRLTGKDDFTKRYAKYSYLGFGYTYVGFNLKRWPFNERAVRLALSSATPRQALIDGILQGQGEAISSVFKPGTWANNTRLPPIAYDPAKAKAILAEAGWADTNGDGIVEKNGKPLAFTLITNQGNDQRIKTAEILQQVYREVGVDMNIQVQEWRTFLENTLYPRNFEAYILGWSLTPEPDPYDIWHSSKQGAREFNVIGFENAEADKLMETARKTFDQAERKKLLDQFQEILYAEQPTLLLYAPYALTAVHRRFKGITPAPAGIGYNSLEWYVPKGQQIYQTAITP
ncbi:MAG: peptide-binding protein [Alphaproteobacteria bacterium]